MKFIIHTSSQRISTQSVNDIFREDAKRDDAVLVSPNIDSAQSLLSQCLLSTSQIQSASDEIGEQETCALLMGSHAINSLRVPTCPVRSCLEKLFSSHLIHTGRTVIGVGISSFSSANLTDCVHLAPRLAQGAGIGENIRGGASSFDHFLDLNFGPRRVIAPRVEIRSLSEYDTLVSALFSSTSFRDAMHKVSLKVNIAILSPSEHGKQYSRVLQSMSFWFLSDRHLDEFLTAVLPVMIPNPNLICAAALVFLTSTSQVLQYGNVAQSIWDQLVPHRRPGQRRDEIMNDFQSPVSQRLEQESIDANRAPSIPQIPSPKYYDAGHSTATAIEQGRMELLSLGSVHDQLEKKFALISEKFAAETVAIRETEDESLNTKRRINTARETIDSLQQEKQTMTSQATVKSEERDRLFAQLRAKETEYYRVKGDRDKMSTLREQAKSEELRRQEEQLRTLQAEKEEAVTKERDKGDQLLKEIELEHTQQVARLEAKITALQSKVAELCTEREAALSDAVSLTASNLQSKREIEYLDRDAHHIEEQLQELQLNKNVSSLTHEYFVQLKLQLTTLQSSARQLEDERQACLAQKRLLQEDEKRNELEQHELISKHKDFESHLLPRHQQQVQRIIYNVCLMEGKSRMCIEAQERAEFEETVYQESLVWPAALRKGEDFFHDQTHKEMRDEMIVVNKKTTQQLQTVSAFIRQAESFEEKFELADSAHAELVKDTLNEIERFNQEELKFRANVRADGSMLEVLKDSRAKFEERTQALRHCLSSAPIGEGRQAIGQVRHPGIVPSTPELIQRLSRLVHNASGRVQVGHQESESLQRKLKRLDTEVEERTSIIKRVRSSVTESEQSLAAAEDIIREKKAAVEEQKEKHNILRQQLKEEYVHAQEVTARHKAEGQQEIARLKEKLQISKDTLRRTEAELKRLRVEREGLRHRTAPSQEVSLLLELQREKSRQLMLRSAIMESASR